MNSLSGESGGHYRGDLISVVAQGQAWNSIKLSGRVLLQTIAHAWLIEGVHGGSRDLPKLRRVAQGLTEERGRIVRSRTP